MKPCIPPRAAMAPMVRPTKPSPTTPRRHPRASVARGLQAVFAPPVDEPVIVASVPGEPPDADQRLRVILDPDDPSKSVAIVPESQDRHPDG
jgi:hypothetical protein